jgi:hypothetical protein
MIYKFKVWVWKPMVTEVFINVDNDEEAAKVFKSVDLNNFNWQREPLLHSRTTYEVIKDGSKITDNTQSTKRDKLGD